MADWTQAYARALGVKWTPKVAARMQQWQRWEGGHTANNATNNYMNSTLRMPGSSAINSVGVQAYKTLGQGAQSFAKTINARGDYAPLKQWLATGEGDPSTALQVWVSGKPDGNPGYAAKVLATGDGGGRDVLGVGRPTSITTPTVGDIRSQVRSQAAKGFADIAQGGGTLKSTQDSFDSLLKTLKSAAPVDVQIPTKAAGGSDVEAKAANLVHKYLGVNYVWGGAAPSGFDCSGLLQYVYKSLGVKIPRTTYQQWDAGAPVSADQLKPGDAVYFTGSDPMNGKPGHVGMYVGAGQFIEAPGRGKQVRLSTLEGRSDYVGARRFA